MAQPAVRQFAGDIRLWQINDDGTHSPAIPSEVDSSGNQPIETDTLTFSYDAGDEIKVVSKRRGARYQQPLHQKTLPGTTSVATTLLEVPPLILARMLFGEGSTATVSAGSATAVAFTLPDSIDLPVQLPHRLLTNATFTVTDTAGTTTYVDGTDYTVDRRRGQLLPLAGGDLVAGQGIKLTYAYAAHVATTIIGGATPTKDFYVTGDMEDRISLENGELTIPKASLTTDGDVDWLSAEPIKVSLKGPCIVADGETAPYTFTAYKVAA